METGGNLSSTDEEVELSTPPIQIDVTALKELVVTSPAGDKKSYGIFTVTFEAWPGRGTMSGTFALNDRTCLAFSQNFDDTKGSFLFCAAVGENDAQECFLLSSAEGRNLVNPSGYQVTLGYK